MKEDLKDMLEFLFFFKEKKEIPFDSIISSLFFFMNNYQFSLDFTTTTYLICVIPPHAFFTWPLCLPTSLSLWLVNITFYVVLWMIFGIFWCPLELMTRPTQISHLNTELFSASQNSEVDGFWSMIEQQKAASLKVNFS